MPVSEEQMNRLLTNISENIPTDCSTENNIKKGSMTATSGLNSVALNITEYEAYRNDVEFGNSFREQVLLDEAAYFTSKYGETVYNYLLEQRSKYNIEQIQFNNDNTCKACPFDPSGCSEYTDASANRLDEKQRSAYNRMISYLQSQLPVQSPDTTFKKVEYRDEAHEFLSTMNHLLTIFYFCLLLMMFVFLVVSQRLRIRERFVLYLFLIVLPFAFPYVFDLLKKIYFSLFPEDLIHGPKNAFLENQNKSPTIDSYNM